MLLLKKIGKAVGYYDRTTKLDPELAQAYYSNRGNAYSNLNQFEKAIADYDRAIELDPELSQTYIQ